MYSSGPSEDDAQTMASFGLSLDDFEEKVVEVWPENRLALEIFEAMGTQWRMGFNGPTGLDYAVIPMLLDQFDVSKKKRKQLFFDLRVMERAALAEIRESQKK